MSVYTFDLLQIRQDSIDTPTFKIYHYNDAIFGKTKISQIMIQL